MTRMSIVVVMKLSIGMAGVVKKKMKMTTIMKVYSVRNVWLHPLNLIFSRNNKRKENDLPEKSGSKKKKKDNNTAEQSKTELMSSISLYMKNRAEKPTASSVPKTEDDIFGSMVAMQMRKLHGIFKAQAQHEINNTLFRFIMTQENAKAQSSSQSLFSQNVDITPTQYVPPLNHQLSLSSSSVTSPTSSLHDGNFGWVSYLSRDNN